MDINSYFKSPFGDVSSIPNLVTLFVNTSFVLAGVILLVTLILGGIGMISAAGSGDPQKMESTKKTVSSALIGFIIVFVSYWIVKLIGQVIGVEIL